METLKLNDFLKDFGLTETEIKVFIELNHLGSSQIGKLIKNTGLHRGKHGKGRTR